MDQIKNEIEGRRFNIRSEIKEFAKQYFCIVPATSHSMMQFAVKFSKEIFPDLGFDPFDIYDLIQQTFPHISETHKIMYQIDITRTDLNLGTSSKILSKIFEVTE